MTVTPACGDGEGSSAGGGGADAATSTPTVVSNAPLSGATDVSRNAIVSVTFSEPTDPVSLSATSFTLTTEGAPVAGSVLYSNSIAFFSPAALFAIDASCTATVKTDTTSASGIALAQEHSWTFTAGDTIDTGLTVELGSDVWIFQISGDLTTSSGAKLLLAGGALPKNIFWQVAGSVDLGTTAHLEGSILTQTSITLRTGASVNGRLLARQDGTLLNSFLLRHWWALACSSMSRQSGLF